MTSVEGAGASPHSGRGPFVRLRGVALPRSLKARLGFCAIAIAVMLASLAVSTDWSGVFGGALGLLMVGVAWADFRRFVVPNLLSGAAFALGLIEAAATSPDFAVEAALLALARAVLAAGLFLLVRVTYRLIRRREGLGLGDVKLAAAAGAWLSLTMLPIAMEVAAVSGLAFYLWRQRTRKRAMRATARLPFGAFFALSIWLTWLLDVRLAGLE